MRERVRERVSEREMDNTKLFGGFDQVRGRERERESERVSDRESE